MQPLPSAASLLETIADLVEGELLPALPEHLQHRARVAGNLARILEREQRLGGAAGERERALLIDLLGHDGDLDELSAQLAGRLRAGADEAFERRAWEALVAIARDDLAIAKPGHDGWEGL